MYYKGIVMKVKKKYAIVLCDNNEYKSIKLKNNIAVAQKIMFTNDDIIDNNKININKKLIAVAAVILIFVTSSILGINNWLNQREFANVVALVTVDINPSIKVSVNSANKVIKVEALNEDGKNLDLSSIIGIDVDEAIETIVSKARIGGFINNEDLEDDFVLITMIPVEKKMKVAEIEDLIHKKIGKSDELQNVNIAMIEATLEQLSEAEEKSIPVGLLVINEAGNIDSEDVSVKDFFANEEQLAVFANTGEIIEQDLEKKIKLVEKYLNVLESKDINVENLKTAFELSKKNFLKLKSFLN
ncbi:anti-sigma factor domain-containing protein [Clostridium sp. 'deep sea']|uniref:anti-sigma factor domain-containing protein n=1 Tax=Clostridium sp. 'deep sea' TaxID=2779445 RepID=UPI00189693A0|nr:anti-sigma factor domain-containing protein [Clostridium sp. 'deep sea']QOR34231.1 anti-sigma factor domain-containing protein [Clostridium sp. 'deep sea']